MTRTLIGILIVMAVGTWTLGSPAEDAEHVATGQGLFAERGCLDCHTVRGVGTPIGPDLSRVGLRYRADDMARWLRDPAAQEPTRHMPPFRLTDAEIAALAAYLGALQ